MSEFYRLPRGLSNHPVFRRDEEPYCRIGAWVWLFDNAVVRDQTIRLDGKPVLLRRGQLAQSACAMAVAWGWPVTNVKRFLRQCAEFGEIKQELGPKTRVITLCNYEDYSFYNEHCGPMLAQSENAVASSAVGSLPVNGHSVAHKQENTQRGPIHGQLRPDAGPTTNSEIPRKSADNSNQYGECGPMFSECWPDAGPTTENDAIGALFPTAEDAIGALWPNDAVVDADCYGLEQNVGKPQESCDYSFRDGECGPVSRVQGTYLSMVRTVRKEERKEEKKEKVLKDKRETQPEFNSNIRDAAQEARPVAALTQPAAAAFLDESYSKQDKKLSQEIASEQAELFTQTAVASVPPVDVVRLVKPTPKPKPASIKPDDDVQFQEFWEAYPKKVDRTPAYAAYKMALRDGATHAELLAGIDTYRWPEFQYCTRAHIWLANKQWLPKNQQRPPPAERAPRGPMSMREAGIRFYGGSL